MDPGDDHAATSPNTSEVLSEGEEFHARPIRLSKQRSESASKRQSVSSGSKRVSMASVDLFRQSVVLPSSSTDSRRHSASSVDSGRRSSHSSSSKSSDAGGEFQCRPMRLSSRHSKIYPSTPSTQPSTPTAANFTTTQNVLTPAVEGSEKRRSVASAMSAASVSSSHSAQSVKRHSIEIRNLPFTKPEPPKSTADANSDMIFAMCLVDFHHQRGPEVQWWRSNYHPEYHPSLFRNLPFQALPDGSHLFEETFSNFNLVYDFKTGESLDDMKELNSFQGDPRHLKTLFGCSCVCQVKTSDLSEEGRKDKDITRSMVQKAVVVIVRKQPVFAKIKEKLSIITKSYFMQETFDNKQVLEDLFDNLNGSFKMDDTTTNDVVNDVLLHEQQRVLKDEEEFFVNLDLRATIMKFKQQFMVIYKALLLEKKIVIYSNTNIELLTLFQNNLISLIPNLINNLDDSGCPLIDYVETNGPLSKPTSLNTTNRRSMLRFFGLPLQLFNTKNAYWNPYLPLQQLDQLAIDSFMIGCSNLLFVNQAKSFGVDIIINLDTSEVTFPQGKGDEYNLSSNDKKFINSIIHQIGEHGEDVFKGNDDYIRYGFEDYLMSLISTTRYSQYRDKFNQPPPGFEDSHATSGDLSAFNQAWVDQWRATNNYKIWNAMADEFIFNFAEPRHVGVDIDDGSNPLKNISNFFSGWKQPAVPTAAPHQSSEASKFITDEPVVVESSNSTTTETATDTTETASATAPAAAGEDDWAMSKLISSWGAWGKKKA
ncbi:hypothetical protein DIURU_004614 [Diutina rugosa]|uniref:UDENN domain-containing protein n=1 Tax=Diutina rugosa TaxID=5481 RepID=A0A642UGN9_DIURU|nr:uncharacterized protein DIURU_004614 [Diutina rugosa]KAA8898594.1 hypothetical protein DIURU_004614 [Diutina rugosa]